jgi:hypothetical protein
MCDYSVKYLMLLIFGNIKLGMNISTNCIQNVVQNISTCEVLRLCMTAEYNVDRICVDI